MYICIKLELNLVLEDKASFKKHIRYAFRIVHIDNIPHVVEYGLVHNDSPFASDSFVPIGDVSVMDARSTKQLPDGSFLSEYIPFYFGPRSPMLYNHQVLSLSIFHYHSEYYITWGTWDQNKKEYIPKEKTHLAVASLNGHP